MNEKAAELSHEERQTFALESLRVIALCWTFAAVLGLGIWLIGLVA